jgi:hypothetical protein
MKKQDKKQPLTPFTIFMNPKIEKQLENGPLLRATGQVIVYRNSDTGKWGVDDVEIVDMGEIVLMGISIKGYKEQKATIEHFKTMGINLYEVMLKELTEYVAMGGDATQFVLEHTGIKLP